MTPFLILGLAWLVPLHFMPWVSWHSEAVGFFAAAILLAGVLVNRKESASVPFELPRAAALFLFAGVFVLFQGATGVIEFWGDVYVLEMYVALCVVGLACGYVRAKRFRSSQDASIAGVDPLQSLAWVLLASAAISALIALVQVFDVWSELGWVVRMPDLRRPGGNVAQPNQLGTLLLMGLMSLLFLRERALVPSSIAASLFAVIALGLAATESRTALLGVSVLCGWVMHGRARGLLKMSFLATGLAAATILGLYVAWPLLMAQGGSFQPDAAVNVRAGWRLVVWPQLLEAVAMRPWQGWGLHEVAKAHNAVVSAYEAAEPYTYAHNLILELALGWGVPLTFLTGGAVALWFWRRVQFIRSDAQWFCIAAALPFFVHSMLEFPYAYSYFLLPIAYLIGVLEADMGGQPVPRLGARLTLAALVPVAALAVLSVYDYVRVEEDFRVARFQAMRIGRTPSDYSRPKIVVLTQLDALLDAARLEPHSGMSPAELQLARQAALRYPWPATQSRYALSLALNGSSTEAIRQLRVIRSLHGEATYRQIEDSWRATAKAHPEWAGKLPD